MGSRDYIDLDETPEAVASTTRRSRRTPPTSRGCCASPYPWPTLRPRPLGTLRAARRRGVRRRTPGGGRRERSSPAPASRARHDGRPVDLGRSVEADPADGHPATIAGTLKDSYPTTKTRATGRPVAGGDTAGDRRDGAEERGAEPEPGGDGSGEQHRHRRREQRGDRADDPAVKTRAPTSSARSGGAARQTTSR